MRTCEDCGRLLRRREAGVDTGRRLFCLECYAERERRAEKAGDGLLPSDPRATTRLKWETPYNGKCGR
jgi:hypothetical protein